MSTVKSLYGTGNQAITITLISLSSGSQRGSLAVDNTSNLFLDALVQVKIKTGASSVLATGFINIYAYGTADGGTDYGDGVTGTDAAQVLTSPPNLRKIGIVNAVANAVTYTSNPMSVAAAFGGVLPDHWGIVVENDTGSAFDGSIASAWYQGILNQII